MGYAFTRIKTTAACTHYVAPGRAETTTKFKFSNFQNKQGFRWVRSLGLAHLDIRNLIIVSNFDLPAKAHRCSRTRAVCAGDSGNFHIRMLLKTWQAGIRISDF
jgi:hypothetical protein